MDVTIPCPCPAKADGGPRHESDTVTLPDVLDFRTTLTVRQTIRFAVGQSRDEGEVLTLPEMTALMAETYILHAISAWSLVDEKGKPLPVSKPAIRERILANYETAELVGDAADDLYSEKVVLPLLIGSSKSSPATPTNGSTSAPSTPGKTPRTPSRPSSTTTSPMVVTGPMAASQGSGSSSSLS